ncbi:MAG: hypothetical protein AAF543_18985 [Pseudomonadota bacterium]
MITSALFPFTRRCLSMTSALACLMVGAALAQTDEQPDPPPDPLAPSAEVAPNQRGYFGGGSVPEELKRSSQLRVGDFALGATAAFGML